MIIKAVRDPFQLPMATIITENIHAVIKIMVIIAAETSIFETNVSVLVLGHHAIFFVTRRVVPHLQPSSLKFWIPSAAKIYMPMYDRRAPHPSSLTGWTHEP